MTKKKQEPQESLQASMARLAHPGLSSRDLLKEVKKLHPKASKKEIIQAAFSSLIEISGTDGEKAVRLQDLAMSERQRGSVDG